MAKGLLLGNGINARLDIGDLSVIGIGERFKKNVLVYSVIIKKILGVQIKEDFWKALENQGCELGIEILAGILYSYIKNGKKSAWTDNDEYRVQDIIVCICITSIFYVENGKISQVYDKSKLPIMNGYDYIFTLNYVEFWDEEDKCIHLHGRIDLTKLCNKKYTILVSNRMMNLKDYVEAVDCIQKTNSVIEFYPNDIIFAPNEVEKNKLVCVTGLHPSNKLYPADDLFFYRPKELYTELDLVDELDVFGMSPYGDESIIDKINSKNRIRVFVYNKNENKETKEWENRLSCKYELLDSNDMR
jgi:hypothetical protein